MDYSTASLCTIDLRFAYLDYTSTDYGRRHGRSLKMRLCQFVRSYTTSSLEDARVHPNAARQCGLEY